MRRNLLRTIQLQDVPSNELQRNVSLAIDTLSSDDDILRFPVLYLSTSGPIAPGKTVVVYGGTPGATLTLPLAAAQGSSVAAVVLVANESAGAISAITSGTDTVNGGKTLSIATGTIAILASDGVAKWLALQPSTSAAPYDIVSNAAFSAATSVPVTWTAGKYRRVEYHLRVTSSGAGNATLTLTGLGGTYSGWNTYHFGVTASPNTWSSTADAANWILQNASFLGQTDGCIWTAKGGLRTHQSRILDSSNGYDLLAQGKNTDTTTDVTGLAIAFAGSTTGWLEVLGYP